ncbi:MAG: pseudouridine synthase [Candidatus Acidiferrales bacterium]
MEERLQKIIARAGVASRRHAEEMIESGLVTVNGRVVTELGTKADVSRDHIKVAGKLLRAGQEQTYLVLHKPAEVVSTLSDPEGRTSLRDLLYGVPERVFPVGRLEFHTSGLLLLTNDGDLANKFLRAHDIPQAYQVKLKTLLTFAEIESLSRATGARIERLRSKEAPWYEVEISEARHDALRNRLFRTSHPVEKMKRVRIGGLELGTLAPGQRREISAKEAGAILHAGKATDRGRKQVSRAQLGSGRRPSRAPRKPPRKSPRNTC